MASRFFRQAALQLLLALAIVTSAAGQAAVEYAAKSAGTSASGAVGDLHVGVCHVDAGVFRCVHDYYPTAFIVIVVGLSLMFLAMIVRTARGVR